jgi:uncharacterized OB-fold protein
MHASDNVGSVWFAAPSNDWRGPVPVADMDSEGFWSGIRDHKLTVQRCVACRSWIHPPLAACSRCRSFELEFEPVSGRGTVYSYTIVHREFTPGILPPYVVALVDLDDAEVRLVSNIVQVDSADIRIGMPVQVAFHDITRSATLALFTPRGGE